MSSAKGKCKFCIVSDLLDTNGSWMADMLETYFSPCDTDEILKFWASPTHMDDTIAWGPEHLGSFSV